MLSVIYAECHIYARYAECHYAECRYVECHYAHLNANISIGLELANSDLTSKLPPPALITIVKSFKV